MTQPRPASAPSPSHRSITRSRSFAAALRTVALSALAAGLCLLPACASVENWFTSSGSISTVSVITGKYIEGDLPTAVYTMPDEFTADVYLTNLPISRLSDTNDTLADLTGTVVHIHVFLVPAAGKTPIAQHAVNASVRQLVVSNGQAGIYSGGGFVFTDEPGDSSYAASVRDSSMRLTVASPGFVDQLGQANLTGGFNANLDEKAARLIAARLAQYALTLPKADAPEVVISDTPAKK